MASMRDWLGDGSDGCRVGDENGDGDMAETKRIREEKEEKGKGESKRVVVLHCKAGKGRSGTVTCAYLVAEEGWKLQDALARFSQRRMRPGFGAGVSIPSQLRYLDYVDRWTRTGKVYVERCVEILEVHVWGLREGVSIALGGYGDEGKRIDIVHRFGSDELNGCSTDDGGYVGAGSLARAVVEVMRSNGRGKKDEGPRPNKTVSTANVTVETHKEARPVKSSVDPVTRPDSDNADESTSNSALQPSQSTQGRDVVLRPPKRIILPTNDVHISLERRTTPSYGFAMVTSLAHVWFNTFFESRSPEDCQAQQLRQSKQRRKSDAISLKESSSSVNSIVSNEENVPEPSRTDSKPIITTDDFDASIASNGTEDATENPSPLTPSSSVSSSGVYTIPWHALDGLKGTRRKGTRALDKLAIVWRSLGPEERMPGRQEQGQSVKPVVVKEPAVGEEISDTGPVDWRTHETKVDEVAAGKRVEKEVEVVGGVATAPVSAVSATGVLPDDDDATLAERVGVKSHIDGGSRE